MTYLVLYLVLHLPALFLCYWAWIQHERGAIWRLDPGWRRRVWWIHYGWHFFGIVGYIPDVVANYTTLFLIFGWPGRAFTFSKHLGRLIVNTGLRGKLARPIAAILNRLTPSGKPHVKAMASDV